MLIPFKPDADLSDLKQALFNLSRQDKNMIDMVLDPICKDDILEKVPFNTLCLVASPAFVVWKDNKP